MHEVNDCKEKKRLLMLVRISKLSFLLMIFISFLNAVIDVSERVHWLLVMLILILCVLGVRASVIADRML